MGEADGEAKADASPMESRNATRRARYPITDQSPLYLAPADAGSSPGTDFGVRTTAGMQKNHRFHLVSPETQK